MEAIRSSEPRDAMALYERSAQQRAQEQVEQPPEQQRQRQDAVEISPAARTLADAARQPAS